MFDFSVAGWNRGGTASLNHKGLVSYDRKIKKDAFYFYKANWNPEPIIHIAEKRKIDRSNNIEVKVYTNAKAVTLYVNNQKNRKVKKLFNNQYNTISKCKIKRR